MSNLTDKQKQEIRKTIIEINELIRVGNNLNLTVMANIFGDGLALHFAYKFVNDCNRNIFQFLSDSLDEANRQKFLIAVLHSEASPT